jgi:hypothetical protein
MAVVRHFAIDAVRTGTGRHSIRNTRKLAGRGPRYPRQPPLATIALTWTRCPGL